MSAGGIAHVNGGSGVNAAELLDAKPPSRLVVHQVSPERVCLYIDSGDAERLGAKLFEIGFTQGPIYGKSVGFETDLPSDEALGRLLSTTSLWHVQGEVQATAMLDAGARSVVYATPGEIVRDPLYEVPRDKQETNCHVITRDMATMKLLCQRLPGREPEVRGADYYFLCKGTEPVLLIPSLRQYLGG